MKQTNRIHGKDLCVLAHIHTYLYSYPYAQICLLHTHKLNHCIQQQTIEQTNVCLQTYCLALYVSVYNLSSSGLQQITTKSSERTCIGTNRQTRTQILNRKSSSNNYRNFHSQPNSSTSYMLA